MGFGLKVCSYFFIYVYDMDIRRVDFFVVFEKNFFNFVYLCGYFVLSIGMSLKVSFSFSLVGFVGDVRGGMWLVGRLRKFFWGREWV